MTEKRLSNYDLELKLHKQSNDLIKFQTNFNDLQIKFIEEKEKTFNLEKKCFLLENELKEIDKKIEKIKIDHKDEINEMKQNFQLLIEEKFQQLKTENNICLGQKDEKINTLEAGIKKANDLTDKKIGDLVKINNLNFGVSLLNNMVFVKIKNKWKEVGNWWNKCCDNNCINTNKPIGNCIEGNGYINIINDENIKYLVGNGGYDQSVRVFAENSIKKPQNCLNYSLYYFEVKCKFEKELNGSILHMNIGLRNCSTKNDIYYSTKYGKIYNGAPFQLPTFSLNDNDIFGCGVVYPPTCKMNQFPYIFFTQNGEQIGKGVLLTDNFDSYKPRVYLYCCSVEANFGNDLESKPYSYDVSKHLILKEFFD